MLHIIDRSTTLVIRHKTATGKWQRHPAARGANGRVKPGHALIEGKPVAVDQWAYEIRQIVDRQPKYTKAGRSAAGAEALRQRTERQTSARAVASDAGLKLELEQDTDQTLRGTAAGYIADAEQQGHHEAAMQARLVCAEFQTVVKRTYVNEITRKDVLAFHAALRKRGCRDRTVANKDARLRSWLRFAGADNAVLPPKPKFEQQLPTIYGADQISSIRGAAANDPYLSMMILIALTCGLREQEMMHLEWTDINLSGRVLIVRSKPKYQYKVKDSEQREITLSSDLVAALKSWREQRRSHTLVLGTQSDKPNDKMLRSLKRLAKREGLNCGHCDRCQGAQGECQEWTLHKFRRTYATSLLRNPDFDLSTVQKLMGHSDLASTMRYLRPASGAALQGKLDTVKWGG